MSANLTTPQHKPTPPSPAGAGQPNPNAEPQQSASGVVLETGNSLLDRLLLYVRRYCGRKPGEYPTVRQAARALNVGQRDIESAVDDHEDLELTSYFTNPPQLLGDHFIEIIS